MYLFDIEERSKFKLDLPDVVLKAVSSLDEMHLDEQGRHLIFRTIEGRVVPIRTTAEDYVSWLETQGISVPEDQQRFYRSVDDFLYRVAEVAQQNPALAMQMEAEWDIRRQGWLMLAKMSVAAGTLRNKCAVEIAKTP